MCVEGFELQFEVFNVPFLALAKSSLSAYASAGPNASRIALLIGDAIRCSVLCLSSTLCRCEVVLVVITTAPSGGLIKVSIPGQVL